MARVRNFKTNKNANLVELTDLKLTRSQINDLVRIFNQASVKTIFGDKFQNKKLNNTFVTNFINYYLKQGEEEKLYLFLIIEEVKIVGGIDLQVAKQGVATVGFWQDSGVSGYMTNSLIAVCKIAHDYGFKILDGYVEKKNHNAAKVLVLAGFDYFGEVQGKTKVLQKYGFEL